MSDVRTRHPMGCECDQAWHHYQPATAADAARREQRERMNAARSVGKTINNLARDRRSWQEEEDNRPSLRGG